MRWPWRRKPKLLPIDIARAVLKAPHGIDISLSWPGDLDGQVLLVSLTADMHHRTAAITLRREDHVTAHELEALQHRIDHEAEKLRKEICGFYRSARSP